MNGGFRHSCVLFSSGSQKIWCWGDNNHGQLGNSSVGEASALPVEPHADGVAIGEATNLGTDGEHTCVLAAKQTQSWCWGLNDSGQIGDGTIGGTRPPTRVVFK